jgi:hypothetical protein
MSATMAENEFRQYKIPPANFTSNVWKHLSVHEFVVPVQSAHCGMFHKRPFPLFLLKYLSITNLLVEFFISARLLFEKPLNLVYICIYV